MTIIYKHGNLLEDDADALVNAVNCVGAMGGGIALAFRRQYPRMFADYQLACRRGEVEPGRMWGWTSPEYGEQVVINFPTKQHWRAPSELQWVLHGLYDLASILRNKVVAPWPIRSVAVPKLGCGLGGLDWSRVRPSVESILGNPEIGVEVRVYE